MYDIYTIIDRKRGYLHEMIARDIPNPDNLPYIKHSNDNICDCRSANLEWTVIRLEGYPRK
jgi:hypothetical protein